MNPVMESILVVDATHTDMASLLQLVGSLSRSHYLAQAKDAGGTVLGEIEVKGSMVLHARVQDIQGKEAVYALLSLTPHTIEAFYVTGAALPGEPVGYLDTLLLDGVRVQDELLHHAPVLDAGAVPSGWAIFDTATDQHPSPADPPATCPFSGHGASPVLQEPALPEVRLPEAQAPEDEPLEAAAILREEVAARHPSPRAVPQPRPAAALAPVWILLFLGTLLTLLWPRKRS